MRSACPAAFVEKYFTGTATTIEGVGFTEIAEEAVRRHRNAYGDNPIYRDMLDVGGDYAFRLRGEDACLDAGVGGAAAARRARQLGRRLRQPSPQTINDQSERLLTLRGLMELRFGRAAGAARGGRAGRRRSSSASPPAR